MPPTVDVSPEWLEISVGFCSEDDQLTGWHNNPSSFIVDSFSSWTDLFTSEEFHIVVPAKAAVWNPRAFSSNDDQLTRWYNDSSSFIVDSFSLMDLFTSEEFHIVVPAKATVWNPRAKKIHRGDLPDTTPDEAWGVIVKAVLERDINDIKDAVQIYVTSPGSVPPADGSDAPVPHTS